MRRIVVPLSLVVVFAVLAEYFVGWRALLSPWLSIDDPIVILGPVMLLITSYLVRALRMYRYFQLDRGFGLCVRLLLHHNVLLNLLPLRTGEFAFPVLMKRYFDLPMQRSIPALLWLRVLDLHTLTVILIFALGVATGTASVLGAAVIWMVLPFLAAFWSRRVSAPVTGADSKIKALRKRLVAAVPGTFSRLAEDWVLTVTNWLLKLLAFGWIVQVFALERYAVSLIGAIAGELTAVLPINGIAGFGTYEGAIVVAMQLFGVTVDSALTGALNLHLLVLGTSILAAAAALAVPLRRTNGLLHPALKREIEPFVYERARRRSTGARARSRASQRAQTR